MLIYLPRVSISSGASCGTSLEEETRTLRIVSARSRASASRCLKRRGDPRVAELTLLFCQPLRKARALLERLQRRPERFLENVTLPTEHRLRRKGMADAATEMNVITVVDLPQHTAAIRT